MNSDPSSLYRHLPSVERILSDPDVMRAVASHPRPVVVEAVRAVLERTRREIAAGRRLEEDAISSPLFFLEAIRAEAEWLQTPSLTRVINATGIVIHTNLGRSPIAPEAFDRAREVALRYSNLEYDLEKGERGSRYVHAEKLLTRITGAEAALVTNNNAGAVLVSLHALAHGREVIVSRGELIEIGGSFRLPEIMKAGGVRLVEVGTTNRTHPGDYRSAITPETALLMKVHLSNFRLEGFTSHVSAEELARIGEEEKIPLLYDLGSGAFVRTGPEGEPTVREELAKGAMVLTMSGDKLLGSVQAGIILGRREELDRIRQSPIMRAVRVDKITLAVLEATLLAYLDPAGVGENVPVLRLISRSLHDIRGDVARLRDAVGRAGSLPVEMEMVEDESEAGGGAIGQPPMRTALLSLRFEKVGAERAAELFRRRTPPVIVRIRRDRVCIDPRTLFPEEIPVVADAIVEIARG